MRRHNRNLALSAMLCLTTPLTGHAGYDIVFTTNAFISAANATYDNQSILVNAASLTIDGQHTFTDLCLTNGATLTHPPTTALAEHALRLSVDNVLTVSTDSKITAFGRGYLPGYTSGNTTDGATTDLAGGSYGGTGAPQWGTPCAVYGDFRNPCEPGSGSGSGGSLGGAAGGGLIRLTAATLTLDGTICADGANHPNKRGGGGSGGGIRLDVGTLRGGGTITANGGQRGTIDNSGGGGGGGRIAIYYSCATLFDLTNNVSCVGTGDDMGAPGTIYLKQQGGPGTVVFDSRNQRAHLPASLWIPAGTNYLDDVTLRGTGMVLEVRSGLIMPRDMHILNGASLTHPATTTSEEYRLELSISGTLRIETGGSVNVMGRGYLPGYTYGNTTDGATTDLAGGSYGGMGAPQWGTPCAVYGDFRDPSEPGSGSGSGGSLGGSAGGGLIRLTAATLSLDGTICADGANHPNKRGGGGSGGGIRLDVGTLRGGGTISANGGQRGTIANSGGGGGGGRIAVYYTTADEFDLVDNISCVGVGGNAGSPGTVFTTNGHPSLAVAGASPSGLVSNVIDSLGVTFAAPVQADSFGLDDIVLRGPTGSIAIASLAQRNNMLHYELYPAHALAAGGNYTLCIGPSVSSLLGDPMSAVYTNTFSIDLPLPDMPTISTFASAPATNLTTNGVVTLTGIRGDSASIWLNDTAIIPYGAGPWTFNVALGEGINHIHLCAKNLADTVSPTNTFLFLRDSVPPVVTRVTPAKASFTNETTETVILTYLEASSGIDGDASPRGVTRNGIPVSGDWTLDECTLTFRPAFPLLSGTYAICATLTDRCGLQSSPFESSFIVATMPTAPTYYTPRRLRGTLFIFGRPIRHTLPPTPDTDDDGLEDSWENEYLGTLANGGTDDPDGDGLDNAAELAAGCDPLSIDTDGDGIDDAADPNPTRNLDTDRDGLADDWERVWLGGLAETGTDDHDGDGRSNAEECRDGTDPELADVADTEEVVHLAVFMPIE